MISLSISIPQLQLFFLVVLRVGAIIMSIPVFDSRGIPIMFKFALSLAIGFILFSQLELDASPAVSNFLAFSVSAAGEIIFGLTIGFSVKIIFAGIQLAGQLAGYQMGLAIANVMDPSTSEQVPLLAQFNNLIGLLIFLSINAHYWFIKAIFQSYRLVPPLNVKFRGSLMDQLVELSGNMFVTALQVGAPVIAAMLLISVAFGLVARTVPQMNVFIVAMPLKIGVGLIFIGFGLPYFSVFLESIFSDLGRNIIYYIKAMS
ncbi:MAG: flagellar biosynthetic protein FliR [Desulfobacterales bacterium]|jgi:flagellar biosynthetic protein FliR